MKKIIYVFSATGNSLTTAREITKLMGDCQLYSISALINDSEITVDADIVGFVFPVYFQDIPYPVRTVLKKMNFVNPRTYIFTFLTSRGYPGDLVFRRLHRLLKEKNQSLSLGLSIPMPGNSRMNTPEEDQKYLKAQYESIKDKIQLVVERVEQDYSSDDEFIITPAIKANNFRGICSDEKCIGCRICVKVCPMNNIHIKDGRAIIGDSCSSCLACFHWCPVEAIYMTKHTENGRRIKYHHPDVLLTDIIQLKKK